MFVYSIAPAANVATHATPNTDVDHLRTVTGASRGARIQSCLLQGKGAGLTAISGIIVRLARYSTPSTVGSAITPRPRHPSNPAAGLVACTGPTVGTTQVVQLAIGCGAAGPGGWVAPNPDSVIELEANGGANGNLDLLSQSGTASLNFEYTLEHQE